MFREGRWHSRGYLPHFEGDDATQHVTFHLADSLPQSTLIELEEQLRFVPASERAFRRWERIEQWMDAGYGGCVLKEPAIASMVQGALLYFDGTRYQVLAWVVMPNHVHVLFTPINGWAVSEIVTSWKVFTARRIRAFERENLSTVSRLTPVATQERGVPRKPSSDRVWHREYRDRYMRNAKHFATTRTYIHENPVKAGLVKCAEDWLWSSAHASHREYRERYPGE